MAAKKTPLVLPQERIVSAFQELFRKSRIPAELYRIYVGSSSVPGQYNVTLVWDGFDEMSITGRQAWIWNRIHKYPDIFPDGLRHQVGIVSGLSAKEVVVADEIIAQENASVY